MMQISEMMVMIQTPDLLLNMMYHASVVSPVQVSGGGQPYQNHNIHVFKWFFRI